MNNSELDILIEKLEKDIEEFNTLIAEQKALIEYLKKKQEEE